MFKQFSTEAIIDSALRAVFFKPPKEFYEPPAMPRPSKVRDAETRRAGRYPTTDNEKFVEAYRKNPLNYLPTVVVNSCMKNRKTQAGAEQMGYAILCSMAREKLVAEPTWEMQSKYGQYRADAA